MNGQGGDILQASEKMDTLPGLRSRSYCGINDLTQMVYAWDRARNGLEPVTGQSDKIYPAGL